MSSSLYSTSWYRVADLKPRLRGHVEIHRHQYRGQLWYVMQDHSSGRFQRFTPVVYQVIGLMNGKRTMAEIWEALRERLEDEALSQDDVIRLLSQLHAIDALQMDVMPDTSELFNRYERQRAVKLKQVLKSPLFMRFPILDPERFLSRYQGLARPFFSWFGLLLWFFTVGLGIFLVGVHWPELMENITDRILAPKNLVVLWVTFPFLKAFHELGHAFAVKLKGGEVHEMGIMLLVFTPIPYVDASSASAFQNKRERVVVGAAGMAVEVFCASLALILWINLEPGVVRGLAYNVIFIAGVSSILFNGNPLLRYDAYYILSDLIEIPNLASRGIQYVMYLIQRYVLRTRNMEPPESTAGERVWFIAYTVASFLYRIFIYASIVLFVAGKFFIIGFLLACWSVFSMFILPAAKGINFLLFSPRLRRGRVKAVLITCPLIIVLFLLIAVVPVPLSTRTEGVVWVPEHSFVRAGVDGVIADFMTEPGNMVKKGDSLIECKDPFLPAEIQVLEARLKEAQVLYDTQFISNRVMAEITKEEIQQIKAELNEARDNADKLIIRSPAAGKFVVPTAQDLPGRYVKRGQLLGYVLGSSDMTARVVVPMSNVDLVRHQIKGVKVRFPERKGETLSAVIEREVPEATDRLPAPSLGQEGGGAIAIDPGDALGVRAYQKLFLFDISLPSYRGLFNVGGRLYVRFDHGSEPLIRRWYRTIRALFLSRFNV